ncbi:MAG: FprA family A-type flavoprotein [Candidatus Bathyarchaeota archaeon]|nr:MAG: FprA family A-type flavoprotein [Candidatus Bathyarchaeota archaeon]
MDLIRLKDSIYWVGAIDWNIRSFHGYVTNRGSSYNAYLVVDDKVALIDTVKDFFFPQMLKRIKKIIEPTKINFLISNHAEPDHSGGIRAFMTLAKNAELIATESGMKELKRYYGKDLQCTTIKEKPDIRLGSRSLQFFPVPMVHWPDSMVTYVPEEKLLFSNDAFGQHLASSKRFDDEVDQAILMQEAKTYYANIVMHLWRPIKKALVALSEVKIDMIAPSHGVVWRGRPEKIVETYGKWVSGVAEPKVIIVYDTMWRSTERIAVALFEGIASEGVEVKLHRLNSSNNTEVITDILDAQAVLIGSPTLNNGLFPTVASFLTYMKGLRPQKKFASVFGSYGWGGGAKGEAESLIKATGLELIESDLEFKFRPSENELNKAIEFGRMIAKKVKAKQIGTA